MPELRLSQWASVTPAAGWVIDAGPFTGAAGWDLFGYHPDNGTLWVAENRGDRFEFSRPWATVDPAAGWQLKQHLGAGEAKDAAVNASGVVLVGAVRSYYTSAPAFLTAPAATFFSPP